MDKIEKTISLEEENKSANNKKKDTLVEVELTSSYFGPKRPGMEFEMFKAKDRIFVTKSTLKRDSESKHFPCMRKV